MLSGEGFFVLEELERLPVAEGTRHVAEVVEMIEMLERQPVQWRDYAFEIKRRALMAHIEGDPTAGVWLAWVRSRELLAQVEAIAAAEAEP